jgi:hypothetical protein
MLIEIKVCLKKSLALINPTLWMENGMGYLLLQHVPHIGL